LFRLDLEYPEDRLVQLFHLYQKYQQFLKYLLFQKNLSYRVLQ
jgi:hypothetical protein